MFEDTSLTAVLKILHPCVCVVILKYISDLKKFVTLTYQQSKAQHIHKNGTGLYEVCYKI